MAGNIEDEEMILQLDGSIDYEDDSVEGWIDERKEMMAMEREELDKSVGPLCLMLTKVTAISAEFEIFSDLCQLRKTAFAIKNSTTIILPKWFMILKDIKLNARMMWPLVGTRHSICFILQLIIAPLLTSSLVSKI